LPVPSSILSMFGDKDKPCVRDDPAVHEGRVRSFAHDVGNWASLIYIPCENLCIVVIIYMLLFLWSVNLSCVDILRPMSDMQQSRATCWLGLWLLTTSVHVHD